FLIMAMGPIQSFAPARAVATGRPAANRRDSSVAQAVELGGVGAIQLALHGGPGVGPGSHAVRVVARPEKIVGAENRRGQNAGAVVLVGEESVAAKIFAGRKLVDVFLGVVAAGAAEPVVDLLHQVRHPADVEL